MELNETTYDLNALLGQVADSVKDSLSEKSISLIIKIDGSVPEYMLGDSGKIGQILNKLLTGCITYSERSDISINASCRKISYASILDIDISSVGLNIPSDIMDSIKAYFFNISAADVISGDGESNFALSLIAALTKQMSGRIEAGNGSNGEPAFRLSIPQLEVKG